VSISTGKRNDKFNNAHRYVHVSVCVCTKMHPKLCECRSLKECLKLYKGIAKIEFRLQKRFAKCLNHTLAYSVCVCVCVCVFIYDTRIYCCLLAKAGSS
jgi:hypothetical protein